MARPGFTLVELVVVLLVLGLVTHLAVREFSRVLDGKLGERADRQLGDIRTAALAYLADVGSPVPVTNGTLSALWTRPAGVRDFAIVPATKANLHKGASSDLVDANVFVPAGWNGPYLHLPFGKSRLTDPWGNDIALSDEAGLARLGVTNGNVAVWAAHLGPTSLERDRRQVSLLPVRGTAATLRMRVVSTGGGTTLPSEITYRWYGPAGGVLTGAVQRVSSGACAVFAGLTPGRRIVWDSVTGSSRAVAVAAGDVNLVEVRVP